MNCESKLLLISPKYRRCIELPRNNEVFPDVLELYINSREDISELAIIVEIRAQKKKKNWRKKRKARWKLR